VHATTLGGGSDTADLLPAASAPANITERHVDAGATGTLLNDSQRAIGKH